jgi:alpha-2-macroglobulin
MLGFFKKRWVWVTAVFLVINILGLVKIISVLEDRRPYQKRHKLQFLSSVSGNVRQLIWPVKKAIEEIRPKEFQVVDINPNVSGTDTSIRIKLNEEVAPANIKGFIEVSPETDFIIETVYDGILIQGNFKLGQGYTVEVLKGMPTVKGTTLKEPVKKTVFMPDYDPTLNFKTHGMYVSLRGNQNIPIEAINVDAIKVNIQRVYDNNIVYLLNNPRYYSMPENIGLDVIEKVIPIEAERNQPKEVLLSLKDLLEADSRGIFFMRIEEDGDDYYWRRSSKIILTSDIGIVVKKSDSDLFVWLNSLSSNYAIEGATVRTFTKTNQQILEGKTNADGLIHFKDVDWSGDKKPFIVTASTDKDQSFIELEKCTLTETDFKIEGRPYISSGYEGFLYTDRGVFRPGDTAHLKAIVRYPSLETPEIFPVVFEIIRPDGREFGKFNGVLSEFGTVNLDIDIPEYALTGSYTVNLKLPGQKKIIGSVQFNVEEFMPDRLKVALSIPDKRLKPDKSASLNVKAEHFFGAPAEGRSIEVIYNLRPQDFKPESFNDYSFVDATKEFSFKRQSLGEKTADTNGTASFELKIEEELSPPSALRCDIGAIVKETGGRAVTMYESRPFDAYPYYIGIRQSVIGYARPGVPIQFDYVAVSPEGKRIDTPELKADIYKVVWNTVLKKDEQGDYRYVSETREEKIRTDILDAKGSVYTFNPTLSGNYIIRISAKDAVSHSASINFYCSESGYMPWAMERPDRLELKLDKQSYVVGETAKLVINSPFKGKALVAISKDRVLDTHIIELENTTQEVSLLVDEEWSPNVYCSITVIRPVNPLEDWVSYRAYGIIPIIVDNAKNRLNITVVSPQSSMPKDTINVEIAVSDAQGNPHKTELSLALVDEGILSLTNFKTPDPFEFFYGKRGNQIQTSDIYSLLIPEFDKEKVGADSSPSGDRAAYDPKSRLNPISAKRVKPIVLWERSIITDENGKANAKFIIPQFSGSLRIMAVAVANKSFGNSQKDLKVIEPLMIEPGLPRVLSTNDEFIVPVSVFNSTGKDGDVTISLNTSDGFVFKSDRSFIVNIKNNKEAHIEFKLKAPSAPQKATIHIVAKGIGYESESFTELAVRPPVPFTTITGSGSIKAPAEESISIPGDWLKNTENMRFVLTGLPALQFAGGLKYLMEYPYGCAEQVTSCVFPLLYLKDIAALVEPDKFNPEQIDTYINSGIRKVLSMQTYSGGFSLWPGYRSTYDWVSVYATDFLVEADSAGYLVPSLAKNIALDYCEKILSSSDKESTLELKAYSCYVLSKEGRVKPSWIRRLQEVKDKLPEHSRFHLAASLFALGDKNAVKEILGEGISDIKIERETGDSLNSYTRVNAIALSVYMDIDPENPMVPVLVKRLQSTMKNGNWQTTQDNSMALLALGKYANYVRHQDTDYSGKVLVDGKVIAEFNSQQDVALDNSLLCGKDIKVSLKGKGTAYYYWVSEGVPVSERVEEKSKGIDVKRAFFNRAGDPITTDKFKQGDVVIVDIKINALTAYKNVVVEDLLPACFEIENPRLATSETVGWISKDIINPDHIDIRDDRLLLFTDLPSSGIMHYRYAVRAVTKGKFILPAINASCMYDPSIISVSGQGYVEVGD